MHKGVAVSPGVVVGVAYRVDSVFGSAEPQSLDEGAPVAPELERFAWAVSTSATELESIVQKVGEQLGPAEAEIFKSHLQIVNDEAMLSKVRALIELKRLTALSAVQEVLQGVCRQLRQDRARLFSRAGWLTSATSSPESART